MAAWYSPFWRNRLLLTVDKTKVGAVVSDFPVYLSGANFPASFWTTALASGNDIRLTSSDGLTLLNHELVHFTPTTGPMELHFKALSLSNLTDTVFYLYYNNPSALAPTLASQQAVWSNGYAAVYHLGEAAAGGGGGGIYVDSTGLAAAGNDYVSDTGKTGQLFATGGQTFSGTGYIGLPFLLGGATAATVSCWANKTTFAQYACPVSEYQAAGTRVLLFGFEAVDGTFRVAFADGTTLSQYGAKTGFSAGSWHHLAGTFVAGSGTGVQAYVDGSVGAGGSAAAIAALGSSAPAAAYRNIGRYAAGGIEFLGSIDEVRLATLARSAPWLTTEVANQSAPSTFYSIGPVEYAPGGVRSFNRLYLPGMNRGVM